MGFAPVLNVASLQWAAPRAAQQALATWRADSTPRQVPSLAYADFARVVGLAAQQSLDRPCFA